MQWYRRVREAINTAMPFLAHTQKTNLALLVSAILKKQTLCLSEVGPRLSGAKRAPRIRSQALPAPSPQTVVEIHRE